MSGSNQKTRIPQITTPLVDPETGLIEDAWWEFFQVLFNRSGGGSGNTSYAYPYPNTTGTIGQAMLTSGSQGTPGIWGNLATSTSQLNNDSGYITSSSLSSYVTGASLTSTLNSTLSLYATTASLNSDLALKANITNPTFLGSVVIPALFVNTISTTANVNIQTGLAVGTNIQAGTGAAGGGYYCRSGSIGAFDNATFNIHWTGTVAQLWINNLLLGTITTT